MGEERPPYLRCTKTSSPLFVVGTVYEVHSYEGNITWIATEHPKCGRLPLEGCEFVPHDPWASYNKAQADVIASLQHKEAGK